MINLTREWNSLRRSGASFNDDLKLLADGSDCPNQLNVLKL